MAFDMKNSGFRRLMDTQGIGGMGGIRNIVLLVFLVVSLVATVVIFQKVLENEAHRNEYISLTDELRLISQQIPGIALEASLGNPEAFGALEEMVSEFDFLLRQLRQGRTDTGLPASPFELQGRFDAVDAVWNPLRTNADRIIDSTDEILGIREDVEGFKLASPELQALMDEVLSFMVEAGEEAQQIYFAALQLTYVERMTSRLAEALQGGVGSATAAGDFVKWTDEFRKNLDNMRGDGVIEGRRQPVMDEMAFSLLEGVNAVFTEHESNVPIIMDGIARFFQVREAAAQIIEGSQSLLDQLNALSDAYRVRGEAGIFTTRNGYISAGVVVMILIALGVLMLLDSRALAREATQRQKQSARQTESQNRAVLRLLDEIEPLQEGDLTVEASVDEAFTGTIADAINSSIETLRNLVSTVNKAATQVTGATRETLGTTKELAEASEQQAKDIGSAAQSITKMAQSMEEISVEAGRSADVAKSSVDIAYKGGETVRDTINGMDSIRQQIQETSKRLKRLGESSQEIGDIIRLINDIADQTNILALNAAIQASSAGEAGRGFAVVADEVQRLAERSANATKQIEGIVTAIQADTNEAVISMEQTTTEVVKGAQRAENAGTALEEIEAASNSLAELIDKISKATNQYADGASKVSQSMIVIEGVTHQTSSGASSAAKSIGELAVMAENLKKQMSGFRLPGR